MGWVGWWIGFVVESLMFVDRVSHRNVEKSSSVERDISGFHGLGEPLYQQWNRQSQKL